MPRKKRLLKRQKKSPKQYKVRDTGCFGKIHRGLSVEEAIGVLLKEKSGEAVEVVIRSDVGGVDLIYGQKGEMGFGIAHIEEKHPHMLIRLENIMMTGELIKMLNDRVYIKNDEGKVIIRLDWDGNKKSWVVTAFD